MKARHLNFVDNMTFSATTLLEVLDIVFHVSDLLGTPLWFRGQGPYYNLTPSILRHKRVIEDQYGRKRIMSSGLSGEVYAFPDQYRMVDEFASISDHLFKVKPANTFEWLCIMQHYGVPTALLDWTVDPIIALFFATDVSDNEIQARIKREKHGAEVWILPPEILNEQSQFVNQKRVFQTNDLHVESFMRGKGNTVPIAVAAPRIEERLILQKCCFTMHGYDLRPLNHMSHNECGLCIKLKYQRLH